VKHPVAAGVHRSSDERAGAGLLFSGFDSLEIDAGETSIFVRRAGSGPPLLLLHGFPETHLMWRDIAPVLAHRFTVVCADLRGYGRSGCPPSSSDHAPYAKRAMARGMAAAMARLGFQRFAVAGHDRGGRVAYRLALDEPDRVERLAVLDVLPNETVWERADDRFALGFWPWCLLAQDEPLPERVLTSAADVIVEQALSGWGTPAGVFSAEVREAYANSLRDPRHAHAICEEYRAAATLDREHDRADRAKGRRIACPLLALWSAAGPLGEWYADEGGPLALWRDWAIDVRGHGVAGGHFFPEEAPEATAAELAEFFGG
jgi:haloacetate dehalogenase